MAITIFGSAISIPIESFSAEVEPKKESPPSNEEHLSEGLNDAMFISLSGDATLRQKRRFQNDFSGPDKVFDLLRLSLSSRRRTVRSASECTPNKIFKSDPLRGQSIWQTVDCDSCKNSKGNSCSPIYAETRFLKYIGRSGGKDYFKYVTELIPSACDCS